MGTIRAEAFWARFAEEIARAELSGYGRDWTDGMYRALHGVQRALGLWCQCRDHPPDQAANGASGERLGIDFLWFESNTHDRWVPPVVAIEHENLWSSHERRVDYWKVCQLAVPLRVFIGYVAAAPQVEEAAKELRILGDRWRGVGGEDLLILGHGRMSVSDFRAWTAPQGTTDWREILPSQPSA